MAGKQTKPRRARGSIDPEKILDGAFEIAEREGLQNLSMPALAAHLEVGVTSIYWYFRNKEDLLRRMSIRATSEMHAELLEPADRDPQEWKEYLSDYFYVMRESHNTNQLRTEIGMTMTSVYSMRTTHMIYEKVEAHLDYLIRAGFAPRDAWKLWSSGWMYTRGFILTDHHRIKNQTPPEGLLQLGLLNPETMPILTELVREDPEIMIDGTGDDNFRYGIQVLLDFGDQMLAANT